MCCDNELKFYNSIPLYSPILPINFRERDKIYIRNYNITIDEWKARIKINKRNFIMKLFIRNKELKELEDKINSLTYKYENNKYDIDKLNSVIKKLKLISNIYPNESIHPHESDYKKDRERLESTGYTMQGCVDNYEIWINKGVKNG